GHAHHATGDILGVAATVDHPRIPVQGGSGVGATHGLVQRGYLIVEGFPALVETPAIVIQQVTDQCGVDGSAISHQIGGDFQQIEQATGVTVGSANQDASGLGADTQPV